MSEEREPPQHRVAPRFISRSLTRLASPRGRLAAAAAAVVAVGLVVTGAVVLVTGPTDTTSKPTAVADSYLDEPVAPTSSAPLSQREPSDAASDDAPSEEPTDSSASELAEAEKAADKRSDALAKLAERVARNSAVPDPLTFRIATLNLLGSSHTQTGGNKSGYASGSARAVGAVSLLNRQGVDVVGLQEFEADQKSTFNNVTGGAWDFFTGSSRGRESIAWRTSAWSYVTGGTRLVPYFRGNRLPMPWVQLKSVTTGRQIFVISIHNPTSNSRRGNNAHWRDVATSIEIDWVRDLSESGHPVLLTGDFNEKVDPFCRSTSAGMVASNGGTASPCIPPAQNGIDWIFGTPQLTFSDHARLDGGSITDHPLIVATATYDGPVPRED